MSYFPTPENLLILLPLNILSLLTFYFIGHLIFKYLNIKSEIGIYGIQFIKTSIGLLISVCAFAYIKSSFNTSLIILPVLGLIGYFINKRSAIEPKNNSIHIIKSKGYYFLGLSSIITFGYMWNSLTHLGTAIHLPYFDTIYYARIANILLEEGLEVIKLYNIYEESAQAPTAYHYTELWLTALYSYLFKIPTLISYETSTMPTLATIVSLGILGIGEKFMKINNIAMVIVVFGIFLTGLPVASVLSNYGIKAFTNFSSPEYLSIWMFPKMLIILLCLIWSSILFIYGKTEQGLLLILLSGTLYIIILPITLVTVAIFVAYNIIIKKNRKYLTLALAIFAVSLFFGVFYGIINQSKDVSNVLNYVLLYKNPVIHIKGLILEVIQRSMLLILTLAIVIFLIVSGRKNVVLFQFNLFFPILALCFIGWIFFRATFGFVECDQFYDLLINPLGLIVTNLSILWVYRYLRNRSNQMARIIFLSFYSFLVIYSVNLYQSDAIYPHYIGSQKYLESLKTNIIDDNLSPKAAYFGAPNTTYMYGELKFTGTEMQLLDGNYVSVCLTIYDDLAARSTIKANYLFYTKLEVFYRYVERLKNEHQYKSISDAQRSFLIENKIDYVFFEKSIKSTEYQWLKKAIKKEIYNPYTNTSVFILDRNRL